MKSRTLTCITAIALFAALAIPVRLAAQDDRDHQHKHHQISPSLFGAESTAWNNLKQFSFGQQVRVVLKGKKSFKGQFQSVTDDAVIIRTNGADQTLSCSSICPPYFGVLYPIFLGCRPEPLI
jgi:hypothetical protein